MHSIAHLLSFPAILAVPVVVSLAYPGSPLFDGGNALVNRADLQDASLFNFAPFNITQLQILCIRPQITVDYSCNLSFHWFDPNSVKQNAVTSGTCQTSWSWDGVTKHNATIDGSDPVAGYRSCWLDSQTFFKVAVPSFWHPGNFTLELAHHYRDDENFTIPWDFPTTFADADILICDEQPLTSTMYHYRPGPINATVVGLID